MADLICPVCGKPNPDELEVCQFCGTELRPPMQGSETIRPGVEPVQGITADVEKINLHRQEPIHPGELPTDKNTADLERALPSWLRTLRKGKIPASGGPLGEPTEDEIQPEKPSGASGVEPGAPDSPDWLSGLNQAASEEEEVPDWLADLRSNKPEQGVQTPAEEDVSPFEPEGSDWMNRLDEPSSAPASETPPSAELSAPPSAGQAEDVAPDWLKTLQTQQPDNPRPTPGGEGLPDWLSGLPSAPAESHPVQSQIEEPEPSGSMPDWMADLTRKSAAPEAGFPSQEAESADENRPGAEYPPASAPALPGKLPDWLSNLEGFTGPESGPPAAFVDDNSLPDDQAPANSLEKPDWLTRLQVDANAAQDTQAAGDQFEPTGATPATRPGGEPLPNWLTNIEPGQSFPGSTPALITDSQDIAPGENTEGAFAMETPDWLSKLNPEQPGEPAPEAAEVQPEPDNLEAAELPSWVQAMRPVESVVESKTSLVDESQVTEQTGPLAGLRGVLPAEPGLGALRIPPAYSAKLNVSEGQQRYASYLEKMVASESRPRNPKKTHLTSNQVWRWIITLLVFLAVGLPYLADTQVVTPTLLNSSDAFASSGIIDTLTGNAPVLVAFDYDPALSGEMEAVAAPLMDQLLSKGVPLAIISTSPTGSILAEHFLQNTPLINMYQYTGGQQIIDLGYLPGGPAGLLYFANDPTGAMPYTVDDSPAWNTAPFQSIRGLNDFAAVIVITDNADTGREWVEQVGSHLGSTPMLMMISAQAEPMLRPYFDSGQLKGLVAGLADAKIYEQKYARPGQAYRYWDSFKVGMLVVEFLIFAGAVYAVILDRRRRHSDSTGAA